MSTSITDVRARMILDCLHTLGDLVVSGPTGTNVHDLTIALRPSGSTR
jgi:glycerate-2-kinase